MILKFIKIFFSVLAIMLFLFLLDVTFYFSNYSKNTDFISKISVKQNLDIFYSSGTELVKFSSWKTLENGSWVFVKNINFVDKVYFSKLNSFDINYNSWIYDITLNNWLFVLDLNDLSSKYKIKWLWFEIEPKSGGMIYIDNTDSSRVFVFSINSVYKFTFKSESWRNLNYYYNYPHNYVLFNIKNNTFSRIWWDVFRLKTIIKDWFIKNKLKSDLSLNLFLTDEKLNFFQTTYNLIDIENKNYNILLRDIERLDTFRLIWEDYINKYSKYFINDAKKRIYYKQSLLNSIQELFLENQNSTDTSIDIINKLEALKNYNKSDYYDILNVINWYYRIIVKNNSLEDKERLNNFLPLIKYIKLVENWVIKSTIDLSSLIKRNQNNIFNLKLKVDRIKLIKENLNYFYLLRNIDNKEFKKLVLNLELKYKQFTKNENISKNNLILIDIYYFWVLNLKQWNDDLELYVLLKNIFFSYDFWKSTFALEKYFNDFVNTYFSKLKIVDWEIIIWQHIDIVLLKSFLYYLEDYLNNFAFVKHDWRYKTEQLMLNIDILEKYMFLNKVIYFENKPFWVLRTWILKNRNLLNNILIFVRENLFYKERNDSNLLITSKEYNLTTYYIDKFSKILKSIFNLEKENKELLLKDQRQRIIIKDYEEFYKKYEEYFLALSSYDDYRSKYNKEEEELNNYFIKNEEKELGVNDIKTYLKQFYWSSFDWTKIYPINKYWDFKVSKFTVYWGQLSFIINPERNYTISDIIIESNLSKKEKFKDNTYILENDRLSWEEKMKNVENEKKKDYDFTLYFKNKFFTDYNLVKNSDEENNTSNSKEESESIRIFKRDKLLSDRWEFWQLKDILNLKYKDIIVKSLEDITIKNAEVWKTVNEIQYLLIFDSKYLIDDKNDKHYFYNSSWVIELAPFTLFGWDNKKVIIWGNKIKIWFNINLSDFRNIFNSIFEQIRNVDRLSYALRGNLSVYDMDIEYMKDWKFIIWFDLNWKNIKLYLSWDKILFTKVNWKVLKQKNISLNKWLEEFLVSLK